MRVAFVTPYLPWPADTGGKLRTYYLLSGLTRAAEVDLYTVAYQLPTDLGPLPGCCREVRIEQLTPPERGRRNGLSAQMFWPASVRHFLTPASLQRVGQRLTGAYDLLVCDELVMAPYLLSWESALGPSTPLLAVRQKIDWLHFKEVAQSRPWSRQKFWDWLEYRRLLRFEREYLPAFDAMVLCSAADAQLAQAMNGRAALQILANGADLDYYSPQRTPDPQPTLLLLGTMHYQPNIDSVLYFFREIHPALRRQIADLQVWVVGHSPPPELRALADLPGVTVTGSVPDVRPYMARSWVMAVPLRLGGGTRLKIVEAMAAGLPVVSTPVGAEGLAAEEGEHLLLAESPDLFTRQTVRLLQDETLRAALAQRARAHVESNYSWRALGDRFARFCHEVAQGSHRRHGS